MSRARPCLLWRVVGPALGTIILAQSPGAAPPPPLQDAAPRPVWSGVYLAEQKDRGEALASASCAACHGQGLAGSDIAPALKGDDFMAAWEGKTALDLFQKLRDTMPADDPGSLDAQQYADLIAYILTLNDIPPGSTALPGDPDTLALVRFTATRP